MKTCQKPGHRILVVDDEPDVRQAIKMMLEHDGHEVQTVDTRLFALLRSALWQKLELRSLLEVYGTAGGGGWFLGTPQQAYLAGFS